MYGRIYVCIYIYICMDVYMCCGADKYVDPANELCEREQPKQ